MIPFSVPALSECPAALFPCLHSHIYGGTVDDLCLVEQSSLQDVASHVWRLPETWCAWLPARFQNRADSGRDWTCRFVPASRGHLPKWAPFFLQTLRILRLVSTLKPRHIVIHSLTCSTVAAVCGTRLSPKYPCDCGNSASLGSAHHRAHFPVSAHRVDLCGGSSMVRCGRRLEQGGCPSS